MELKPEHRLAAGTGRLSERDREGDKDWDMGVASDLVLSTCSIGFSVKNNIFQHQSFAVCAKPCWKGVSLEMPNVKIPLRYRKLSLGFRLTPGSSSVLSVFQNLRNFHLLQSDFSFRASVRTFIEAKRTGALNAPLAVLCVSCMRAQHFMGGNLYGTYADGLRWYLPRTVPVPICLKLKEHTKMQHHLPKIENTRIHS